MKTTENSNKLLVEIVDSLCEIKFFIEKAEVLADEILTGYFGKINFKTERGRLMAEYDSNIAKVKSEVVCDYITQASDMTEKLLKQSNDALETMRI